MDLRRRVARLRPRVVVAAVVAVVLVAGAVFYARIDEGTPLEEGNLSGMRPVDHDESAGGYDAAYVRCREGERFTWTTALRNRSGATVRVEGFPDAVPKDPELSVPLDVRQVAITGPRDYTDERPFAPLDLDPGEEVALRLHGRLADCADYDDGSFVAYEHVDVEVSRLGRRWTQRVPVRHTVVVALCGRRTCAQNREFPAERG